MSVRLPTSPPQYDPDDQAQMRALIEQSDDQSIKKNVRAKLKTVVTAPVTVANLPPNPHQGERSFVTDATATTFMSTVAGSGSNKVPVVYDGSAWKIG